MSDQAPSTRLEQLEADNARLRRLLDQQDVVAELRHQARNTLSSVRALIRRSAETSLSVEDYAAHLEGRFDVLLRVQTTIMNGRNGVNLHSLVAEELDVFGAQEDKQVRLSGPRLSLRPKAAEIIALAIHELATNAVKFGALSVSSGRIEVIWHIDAQDAGQPWLTLDWQEQGMTNAWGGLPRRGFGREVLESMMPYELKAMTRLELHPAGLRCNIKIPFSPNIGVICSDMEK